MVLVEQPLTLPGSDKHAVTVHLVDVPLRGGLELLVSNHPDVSLFPSEVWNGPVVQKTDCLSSATAKM